MRPRGGGCRDGRGGLPVDHAEKVRYLRLAAARVDEANAVVGLARATQLPEIDLTAGASRARTPVAAGGSTSFSVSFQAAAVGTRVATVSFGNNDVIRNPFTFAIEGTGKISTLPSTTSNGTWTNVSGGAWAVTSNWAGTA